MATAVEMPKMSDTMEEGVLVAWLAEEGDAVSAGDVIAQVETDKATMDLEVYDDGVLLKKVIGEGDAVPIGALIAVLGKEGEDPSSILANYGDAAAAGGEAEASESDKAQDFAEAQAEADTKKASADAARGADASARRTTSTAPSGDGAPAAPAPAADAGRVKASPLARRLATEHGIELSSVQGSGPEGRIIKRDIEARVQEGVQEAPEAAPAEAPAAEPQRQPAPARPPAAAPAPQVGGEYRSVRITQMRKAIARRLAQSKYTAPHFYLTADFDVEKLGAFRAQLNELAAAQDESKVSFNDLVTKACALALRQHPAVNASYLEEQGEIRQYENVHVAVAVAMDEGLITPVIRDADRKGLATIARETRELAGRAREGGLQPAEYEGSTFTTSNLGMYGIEQFTAIINPPNACILAIGAMRDEPVVKDGAVVPGKRMKVTLSCDHRVVDGALGAQFLATVRRYLEEPMNLLL